MILVTGSVLARPDCIDQALAVSLAHVRRSRTEPGCISHNVSRDAENPLRLVFVEEWQDHATLMTHFGVAGSRAFIAALQPLVAEAPKMQVYSATPVKIG